MTEEIIANQNENTQKVLECIEKFKADYHELCRLKDMRIAELEEQIKKMKDCSNCKYKYIQDNADLGEGTRTDPCLSCRSHNMWEFED